MTTGAGFVSFFCHYPFNPQKPLHLVWRWVTLRTPTPPHPASPLVFLLVSTSLSTGEHERSNCGKDALRWRLREEKRGMDREVEREREIEGGIDFHLQQLQFKASKQFRGSAGPGMSLARARLPVCGQDFPCGPWDSQAAPKKNNYSDRRERCVRSQACKWKIEKV